jgi:peptidoglycan/LPS O-acetylase OafA/YrhL
MNFRLHLSRNTPGHIPGLDGLRALSIMCVIYGHLLWAPGFAYKGLAKVINPASLGVRVFFVISGFLITTLLLNERHARGGISLGRFYYRRAMRIFPAYYVFLFCVFVLAQLNVIVLERSDYFYTLTYTFNLKGQQSTWWVGHTWSLGVEEQFYLLWPLVVMRFTEGTLKGIAWSCVVLAPLARTLLLAGSPEGYNRWFMALPFVADPIAIGALLALAFRQQEQKDKVTRLIRSPFVWFVPFAVCIIEGLHHRPNFFPHPLLLTGLLETVANLGLAFVVARVVLITDDWVSRVLNTQIVVAIGIMSYSLYLWQMLFINPVANNFLVFPLNLCLTVAAAMLSYLLIERPFLQLRSRASNARQHVPMIVAAESAVRP